MRKGLYCCNEHEKDPDAQVIALLPKTLTAINRLVCEICNKGFQRDQNLQLHRRGHNFPWKLKQRTNKEEVKKKEYICPETTWVHHHASRVLKNLTGIKKHFSWTGKLIPRLVGLENTSVTVAHYFPRI